MKSLEIVTDPGQCQCFSLAGGGREAVPLHKQLLMTLHFVAHEAKYFQGGDKFGVSHSTMFERVYAVLYVLADELLPKFVCWPSASQQRETSEFYEDKYSFPGVVGAIDGTHIQIARPPDCFFPQDYFSNRTKRFTMNCQITAVQDLRFSSVDIGHPGKDHDAQVFRASDLWFESGERVESMFASAEYHIVGDAAYPIKSYLLKPYRDTGGLTQGQRAFNHRLSRVRVVSERAIGRWKGRFKRLRFIDCRSPVKARLVIAATAMLHNFCILKSDILDDEDVDEDNEPTVGDMVRAELQFGVDAMGTHKRAMITEELS